VSTKIGKAIKQLSITVEAVVEDAAGATGPKCRAHDPIGQEPSEGTPSPEGNPRRAEGGGQSGFRQLEISVLNRVHFHV
jgi:hypothetical protein